MRRASNVQSKTLQRKIHRRFTHPTLDVNAQDLASVAKLARNLDVPPQLLSKFSQAGLSGLDLGKGLSLARDISGMKNLDIGEVAEQVLNLKQAGKEWPDIARNFDVELPRGFDSMDLKSLTGD